MKIAAAVLGAISMNMASAEAPAEKFLWGAASAAYQIEGATTQEGRGPSVWDVYLDEQNLAGPGITGKVAINFYDRKQYLQDIALFRKMGLTSYRFSISWTRIIPDGLGPVNPAAVAHYRQFIADLKAAGIKPLVTLYHWDMPASLAAAGGWENRASIDWFQRYASVIFANFADQVDSFVLVNEPSVEHAMQNMAHDRAAGQPGQLDIVPGRARLEGTLKAFNHILLASAAAKTQFVAANYRGRLGLAVPLFPTLTGPGATAADVKAARLADGVLNRWFLDAMYKGTYPADLLQVAADEKLDIDVRPGDAATIGAAKFDFLGINYYAPLYVRQASGGNPAYDPRTYLPTDQKLAFNGAVRPDQFNALLGRIRDEYGNPPVIITENGAGFPGEDVLKDGAVNDIGRCQYIVDHVAAMQSAMKAGANVQAYHVWSSHDNLEWLFGYASRFGMIYVDYDTQKRVPKRSAKVYADIIRNGSAPAGACAG